MDGHASLSSVQAPAARGTLQPPCSGELPCVDMLAGPGRPVREQRTLCLEDSGPEVWPVPAGVTIFLLIWPQDNDVVPPSMESLISAPLVKTLEKEEEQVSLWGGPLRTWRGGALPSKWDCSGGRSDPGPAALARTS